MGDSSQNVLSREISWSVSSRQFRLSVCLSVVRVVYTLHTWEGRGVVNLDSFRDFLELVSCLVSELKELPCRTLY